ncbi:hypothetical protein PLESTB_001290800 [Pleodorina starrii]|uniref:Uncharacterized protein n=1 Tax=Pleodorina starrii TaxID=330485 RepID=A0A9W6F6B3_9CHLO|nr:hypothetical protein PLESTM_000958000 [Pleodorina starrii]GLC57929.1 hypothetical protein PLESTB_001290800 [Pleodorina starrii]
MAELTYTGRGNRGAAPSGAPQPAQQQKQQQAPEWTQRPSTASPRLEGNPRAAPPAAAASPASAQRMLAFLDSAERAAAKQPPHPMFPPSPSDAASPSPGEHGPSPSSHPQQRQRPKSAAASLRASVGPRILELPNHNHNQQQRQAAAAPKSRTPPPKRQYGRVSLYDHSTADRSPHEVPGPVILRELSPPRLGFPSRPPEDFLRGGEGLSLRQRNQLKEKLKRHPVNTEPPFQPGTGGVCLRPPPPGPPSKSPRGAKPLDWGSSPSSSRSLSLSPPSLLRTYYDNGTLDFVAVRWRGSRADALVWARGVTKGPETSGPHTRSFVSWGPEPPAELDLPSWLPIFIDGVREYDEPYRFIAIRGSEELLLKAGDTLHNFAERLVSPFRSALHTREPTCVAVALQLMSTALALDRRLATSWAAHYWQFAQVLNLFRSSRAGSLLVDFGYNTRSLATTRRLAADFMDAFQVAGGELAAAAVRRYSPGHDPAVTDAVMARQAAKARAREAEAGRTPGEFKPFTLF